MKRTCGPVRTCKHGHFILQVDVSKVDSFFRANFSHISGGANFGFEGFESLLVTRIINEVRSHHLLAYVQIINVLINLGKAYVD